MVDNSFIKENNLNEFTFRFYGNEKHLYTRKFYTETIEQAYKMADNVLMKTQKFDDWECLNGLPNE